MRILQLISSEGVYGAETMLLGLAKSLTSLGHEAVLGVFRNAHRPHTEIADAARLRGLAVEIIPCNGRVDWAAVRAVQRCIKAHSIDVVHTHGYKGNLYGLAAARQFHAPVIATCHNWTDETASLRVYRYVDYLVLRRFRRIVAVSDAVAALLRTAGIPSSRITTIDNGIDLSPFKTARPKLREEMKEKPGMLVGLVGRLTPPKGGEYFLQAAREVLAKIPAALFVLVGEGPERQTLEGLARQLGISRQVVFAGHRNDMPEVYASLDVLVLPSFNEGLPMTIMEAMASGKPVIATPVGAVPKLITAEQTGLFVNPGDSLGLSAAILRILSDSSFREKLGRNGRAWVAQHFSAEAMARSYSDQYRHLTEKLAAAA